MISMFVLVLLTMVHKCSIVSAKISVDSTVTNDTEMVYFKIKDTHPSLYSKYKLIINMGPFELPSCLDDEKYHIKMPIAFTNLEPYESQGVPNEKRCEISFSDDTVILTFATHLTKFKAFQMELDGIYTPHRYISRPGMTIFILKRRLGNQSMAEKHTFPMYQTTHLNMGLDKKQPVTIYSSHSDEKITAAELKEYSNFSPPEDKSGSTTQSTEKTSKRKDSYNWPSAGEVVGPPVPTDNESEDTIPLGYLTDEAKERMRKRQEDLKRSEEERKRALREQHEKDKIAKEKSNQLRNKKSSDLAMKELQAKRIAAEIKEREKKLEQERLEKAKEEENRALRKKQDELRKQREAQEIKDRQEELRKATIKAHDPKAKEPSGLEQEEPVVEVTAELTERQKEKLREEKKQEDHKRRIEKPADVAMALHRKKSNLAKLKELEKKEEEEKKKSQELGQNQDATTGSPPKEYKLNESESNPTEDEKKKARNKFLDNLPKVSEEVRLQQEKERKEREAKRIADELKAEQEANAAKKEKERQERLRRKREDSLKKQEERARIFAAEELARKQQAELDRKAAEEKEIVRKAAEEKEIAKKTKELADRKAELEEKAAKEKEITEKSEKVANNNDEEVDSTTEVVPASVAPNNLEKETDKSGDKKNANRGIQLTDIGLWKKPAIAIGAIIAIASIIFGVVRPIAKSAGN